MFNFLFETVSEASKIILNARCRYQKYSTKLGEYVGKKKLDRTTRRNEKLKENDKKSFQNEKSLLEVLTTQMFNFLFKTVSEASKSF